MNGILMGRVAKSTRIMIAAFITLLIAAWAVSCFMEVVNRDKYRRRKLADYFRQRYMK